MNHKGTEDTKEEGTPKKRELEGRREREELMNHKGTDDTEEEGTPKKREQEGRRKTGEARGNMEEE
ncbi:MAG: hypothetical protein RLZZ338_2146 [Cyanobacteriota bacterium]|jgi:hypothetical protein